MAPEYSGIGTSAASVARTAAPLDPGLYAFGMFLCVLVLVLLGALMLIARAPLLYSLLEIVHWLWALLLLDIEYSPQLASFLLAFKPAHLYFLNFDLVPVSFLSESSSRFYQYAVDCTFLRSTAMDLLVLGLGGALWLAVWAVGLFHTPAS